MLVNPLALLLEERLIVNPRQEFVEGDLDQLTHGGPGLLLAPPVEHKLFILEP